MSKEIIVNVGDRETRIAVLENSRLSELQIERGERIVGSLYKGRVENVLPGMDAAFLDIGLGRNAFLHVGDLLPGAASSSRGHERASSPDDDDDSDGSKEPSNDKKRLLRRSHRKQQHITDLLKRGQEVVVQVTKGPRGSKGARVSTLVSLPGRYLVLMPEAESVGVSRKVDERTERDRLRKIGERLRQPGFGIILRTEAEDKPEADLATDHDYLMGLWRQIQDAAMAARGPTLLHRDLTIVSKAIRDLFGSDVERLIIDDPDEYQKIHEALQSASPHLRQRIQLYTDRVPIFTQFGLEPEIERSLQRRVWLKSGGHLIIDVTEALTVVDVNTGKFTGGANLAETIAKTNVEAAAEIARQLRLRDIGGIIIIDFIDMSSVKDRQQVLQTLETAFRRDKARTRISPISPLGLVEVTRKRTAETVADFLSDTCDYCGGRGTIPSPETMAMTIEREILAAALDISPLKDALVVRCSPATAEVLIGEEGANVDHLEQRLRMAVYIRGETTMAVDKYEIRAKPMIEIERAIPALRHDQIVEGKVTASRLQPDTGAVAWTDGILISLDNGRRLIGQQARIRLGTVKRSWSSGALLNERPEPAGRRGR